MLAPRNHHRTIRPDTMAICALVIVGPQLFGGAFPWTVVVIAALSIATLGVAMWVRRRSAPPIYDGLLLVMSAAWVWTCVQALPLPRGVATGLRLASAANAERLSGLEWAGTVPLTISQDPGSTELQVLVGIVILASFLAARLGGREGLRSIAVAFVLSAILLTVEGVGHAIAGASAVFGSYAPRFTQPQLLTPLMNSNHLGGFAATGSLLAAGLSLSADDPTRRVWAVAAACCAVTVAWTLSRGAIGGLVFGFGLLTAWIVRGERGNARGSTIRLGLIVSLVVGALAFAGLGPLLKRFETQGLDKLVVAARGLSLLEGPALWLGVGRGAFSSTFVSEEGSLARYTHPENILVQWVTEWGLPLALALLVVLIPALWRRMRAANDPLVAAACIASVTLGLQNLVDFSLEMAGVVVAAATLLGALLPVAPERGKAPSMRMLAALIVTFSLLMLVLAPRVLNGDTQSIVDRLTRAMEADDEAEFQAALRMGLTLHPHEPAFALLAGSYAASKNLPDAPRWLSLVMEQAPGWGSPHAVTARWLLARGQLDQALLEIREAEERHPGSGQKAVCDALARAPQVATLERAAPQEELKVAFLNRATVCQTLPTELRIAIDAAILRLNPTHPSAVLRESLRLSRLARFDDAIFLLERAVNSTPEDANLRAAVIRTQLAAGDVDAASGTLEAAKALALSSGPLLEAEARVWAASGQIGEMRATLARLRGEARGNARMLAAALLLGGDLEAALGHTEEALTAYAAADAANAETPALQRAAELAVKSGMPSRAARLYGTLCRRQPGSLACDREAELSRP